MGIHTSVTPFGPGGRMSMLVKAVPSVVVLAVVGAPQVAGHEQVPVAKACWFEQHPVLAPGRLAGWQAGS